MYPQITSSIFKKLLVYESMWWTLPNIIEYFFQLVLLDPAEEAG